MFKPMVFAGKGFGTEGKFYMACEYCEGDRDMLAATSSYTGATADETLVEGLCILPASPNEKPIRKHVIVTYMADGSEIRTKPITYCPFCGRKL